MLFSKWCAFSLVCGGAVPDSEFAALLQTRRLREDRRSKTSTASVLFPTAPPVAVSVAIGNPSQFHNNPTQCGLTANARHSVRCCSDNGQVDMSSYGCNMQVGSCDACRSATYLEAVDRCESNGFRLCSLSEGLGPDPKSCSTSKWCNTGCNMNNEMFWTSSSCTASCPTSTPKNFAPWARLDYLATTACDPQDPHRCFGNGDCVCNTCVCRLGWRGPYCSQLDLLPAQKGSKGIPMSSKNPTWGGAARFENGKVMFLAGGKRLKPTEAEFDPVTEWGRIPVYDPLAANPYQSNDPYTFTVSNNPFKTTKYKEADPTKERYDDGAWLTLYKSNSGNVAGPYDEEVPKFLKTFRVDLKVAPTGSLLLLGNMGGGFSILESPSGSIQGPWYDKDSNLMGNPPAVSALPPPVYKFADNGHCRYVNGVFKTGTGTNIRTCSSNEASHWACHVADPSFVVHPNGTTVIMFRGTKCDKSDTKERIGTLVSKTGWKGPYTLSTNSIFSDAQVQDGGLEDLFMWLDHRGTHMVVHSQALDHSYTPWEQTSFVDHKKKRGAYLFSADGLERWSLSDWELFPSEIRWDDDTTQFLLKQQRPSIIFDKLMQPQYLVTGVDYLYDACCDWYPFGSGWTLMQPIVTTCPAGQISIGGACSPCIASSVNVNCAEATTKYGKCVCAKCNSGWQGDECKTPDVTCSGWEMDKFCADMTGNHQTFDQSVVNSGTCQQTCQDYGRMWDLEGCCFLYETSGQHGNCRFFPLQSSTSTSPAGSNLKKATICSRR